MMLEHLCTEALDSVGLQFCYLVPSITIIVFLFQQCYPTHDTPSLLSHLPHSHFLFTEGHFRSHTVLFCQDGRSEEEKEAIIKGEDQRLQVHKLTLNGAVLCLDWCGFLCSEELERLCEEGVSLKELKEKRDQFAEKLINLRRKLDVCK